MSANCALYESSCPRWEVHGTAIRISCSLFDHSVSERRSLRVLQVVANIICKNSIIAGVLGTLFVSHGVGSHSGLLPQPLGRWLVHYKYIVVGVGFASLAGALYPRRSSDKTGLPSPLIDTGSSTTGRVTAFAFFFHLVFAVAAALLKQPLMQQPTPAHYAGFLVLVCLSIIVTALAAHAFAAVLERIYITIISFLKSISLRMLKRE